MRADSIHDCRQRSAHQASPRLKKRRNRPAPGTASRASSTEVADAIVYRGAGERPGARNCAREGDVLAGRGGRTRTERLRELELNEGAPC